MIGRMVAVAAAGVAAYAVGRALARPQRDWTIGYSRDGFHLRVWEVPMWADLAERTLEELPCTCDLPDWAYRVGPRRFGVHDDGSGDPLHSLGSAGYSLCQVRHSITSRWETSAALFPLMREQAQELAPGVVTEFDDVFGATVQT